MVLSRHPLVEVSQTPGSLAVMLMSDLHIGAAATDYAAIERDLKLAREHNAIILINGDVLDLILPGDRKRYDPRALHSDLQNRADVVDASVAMAVKVLKPYADLIHMIGIGNHETATERHCGTNPGASLVKELIALGSPVQFGGIGGRYRIPFKVSTQRTSYTIRYHHGAGGASPVTKGIIDFARFSAFCEGYDVLWIGHKHNRFIDTAVREIDTGFQVTHKPVLHIMTGAYFAPVQQTPKQALANRQSTYAQDVNMAPQRTGGVLLSLTVAHTGHGQKVEVSAKAIL